MKRLLFLGLCLQLVGCASAKLIESRYEPVKGGVVKFKPEMMGKETSADKAKNIMSDFCAPAKYVVVQQNQTEEITGYSSNTNSSQNGSFANQHTTINPLSQEYTFIHFRCGAGKTK